jgi:hypothetical protein
VCSVGVRLNVRRRGVKAGRRASTGGDGGSEASALDLMVVVEEDHELWDCDRRRRQRGRQA